jgi:hypothetical protein
LPTLVAQRVVLSLEAIIPDFFFQSPLIPRNHKKQMFALTRPAILASTKRAFATTSATLPRGEQSIIPLSNVEAQWATLSTEEQAIVHRQLAELQKRDWKSLSRDEKKAGQSIISVLTGLLGLALGKRPLVI